MAGMCRGGNIGGETETAKPVEPSSQSTRKRRMEIHQFRFVASDVAVAVAPPLESGRMKRPKLVQADASAVLGSVQNFTVDESKLLAGPESGKDVDSNKGSSIPSSSSGFEAAELVTDVPKFGMTSVCGRRRDMEDAVSIHPSFSRGIPESSNDLHFYGVFDGHGCSHVAMRCKDMMHEIVKDELERGGEKKSWEDKMRRSFSRMDEEVTQWSSAAGISTSSCRCELRTPQCDAVGSTAVVAVVTPDKIIISNCGDSRAVLGRDGKAIPLSVDHKPDRPDELERIEEAGGRVIYWDGARVLGVLAMSRAIGDNYLKPYVISDPEVTVIDRTAEDDCLILATDGLWDVVSNETACGVARICLQSLKPSSPGNQDASISAAREGSDKACSDASILLTKLALARHSTDNVSVVVVDLRKNQS